MNYKDVSTCIHGGGPNDLWSGDIAALCAAL